MKKTVISTLSALMGAAIGAGIVGRAAGSKKNSIQAKFAGKWQVVEL